MSDFDDPLPQIRAEIDQAIATIPELTPLAKAWFDGFVKQGFGERQAPYLTAVQLQSTPGNAPS
jgi:hypothetical protein